MRELGLTAVIGLAGYRVWALIALDEITRPARERVFTEARTDRTFFRWLLVWLTCPWCAGTWITAAITLAADLTVDGGVPAPVLVFAGAAAVTGVIGGRDDRLMASGI